MEPLKKHGDPLDEEIRQETVRGADEVTRQPARQQGPARRRGTRRSSAQPTRQPNPNHPSDDATMEPGGDLGQKRNTM